DVKDCFEENRTLYLVMEYVEGYTLERILEAVAPAPIALDLVERWTMQLCSVLQYLHCRQPAIIFRDLKPGNVVVDMEGNLHLIDFGIARVLEANTADLSGGQGTPGYAPLEQLGTMQTPSPATDVYAFGATLYRMLTHLDPPDARLRLLDARLEWYQTPDRLRAVVERMMALKAEDRPQQMEEVREALLAVLAPPPEIPTRLPEPEAPETRRIPPKAPPTVLRPVATSTPDVVRTASLILDMREAAAAEVSAYVTGGRGLIARRVEVRITRYQDGEMTLVHPWRANLGNRFKVHVDSIGSMVVQVVAHEIRDAERYCQARIEEATPDVLEHLARALPEPEMMWTERRRVARQPASFAVTSRHLPTYRALAQDLSLLGVRLSTQEGMPAGQVLDLHLDFDEYHMSAVNVAAQVRWSVPSTRGAQVGLMFVAPTPEATTAIEYYLQVRSRN
ncbi:MAG: serine/threonine protein kinase, partial [Candidatus Xenobia bacterium]